MKSVASRNPAGCISWILVEINATIGTSSRGRRWRDRLCSRQCFRSRRRRTEYWCVSARHNEHQRVYDHTQLYSHMNVEAADRGLFKSFFWESTWRPQQSATPSSSPTPCSQRTILSVLKLDTSEILLHPTGSAWVP